MSRLEAWCHRVDLARDIGSHRWCRGLATLVGLGAGALFFAPDFTAIDVATAAPLQSRERDEFLSQTIAPLALGADTGRHMGASPLVRPLATIPERPEVNLVATLGQGDSFARMLQRVGVGSADIAQVSALVNNAVPVSDIGAGTKFDITLGGRPGENQPRALKSIDFRARFDLDLAIQRGGASPAARLAVVRRPIAVDDTPLRIRGSVGSSLYLSARNAGAPIAAIQSFLQAIDRQGSLRSDLMPNDQYDMILSYKRSAKGEREVGQLLYAGVVRGGKPSIQLMRWGNDGQMLPAPDSRPVSVAVGAPVAGHLTSGFGMRRHPILGYVRMHAGVDFGAAYGSPIYAVSDGRVTYAGRHGGHGNYVRLDHGGGLGTGYAHMSRIAVAYGARVRAGQVIGYVGSSGLSTGPHLHFEAYRNGQTINPLGIRLVARPQIDPKERDAYKARLAALMRVEPGAALADLARPETRAEEPRREIDRLDTGASE